MSEEAEIDRHLEFDAKVHSRRWASETSQDISDALGAGSIDVIFDKDTLKNLFQTKRGCSSPHDRRLEDLQQAYSEYKQSLAEADMLESHITQATALAATKEFLAYERLNPRHVRNHDGVFVVKSTFSWCVDSDLLERHGLICPDDYLSRLKPRFRPPKPVKVDPTRPTFSFTMRVAKEPQDDSYLFNLSPEESMDEVDDASKSLTCESSSNSQNEKKSPKEKPYLAKPPPKWKGEPSAWDKAQAKVRVKKMTDTNNFLRNPHFMPANAQPGGMSLIQHRRGGDKAKPGGHDRRDQSIAEEPAPVFVPNPPVVIFTDYCVGHVYEATLELKNFTSSSRHVRVIPPTTPYFSVSLGRFPGEGGVVAPGMSCQYTVQFAPQSLADYEDFIVVESLAERLLVVPVVGARPPPVLTIPRVLDCGYCLIGGVKFLEFQCRNIGLSTGSFCIIPKHQWPISNLRTAARSFFSEQPPFAISPSLFVLQPGEAVLVEVVFFPVVAEMSSQDFTIVCDNCQVKDISIQGQGQSHALQLVSGDEELPVSEGARDLTAEHFVRFSSCNPHSFQQKKIVIRNNVHLELPFHWNVVKPNLHPLSPGKRTPVPPQIQFRPDKEDAFNVSPSSGLLAPCQDQEFLITFCPKELKDYHSVYHLVLRDVPDFPKEPSPSVDSTLQPVRVGSKLTDVIVMEIEVKGSTEPYHVLLEPYAVVIPGEFFIHSPIHRRFQMWNRSQTFICFEWERMSSSSNHIIEIQPSIGRIEQNECFDFDLTVTGMKPEKIATSLVCHIEYRHEPVTLPLEVTFKGPTVTISVPNVDFGLLRLGENRQTTLHLTNDTQLEASWTMTDRHRDLQEPQILMNPCRGMLPPHACCRVFIFFKPSICQQFETELALEVENGTGCHLSVRADVQTPHVCLLNCELLLSDLYIGVSAKRTVSLFNQTVLPAHFTWKSQLQGKQAFMCSALFNPSSGTLAPNATVEIMVTFTPHSVLDLTDVVALCEVEEMESPLVLGISVSKTRNLIVSYSLPSTSSDPDETSPPMLLLDFGADVVLKKPVTRQLLVTNESAIPAPFTIEAEYFSCHPPKPCKEKRYTYVKKPLHSVQARKVEEKTQEDFVLSALANGKGAIFFVKPSTGILGAFETQTVDVTAHTDMWGEYCDNLICKVGHLEPTLIPMMMIVTGCPLYFQMTGPRLDEQTLGPVVQFGSHISGGDTVSRSLQIQNPTMIDIRLNWELYNIDWKDPKMVDLVMACGEAFPLKDAYGNVIMDDASSKLQSLRDIEREKAKGTDGRLFLDKAPLDKLHPDEKVLSIRIRPHVGHLSDYPYCITPQQVVVPGKSSCTIHFSYTPLTLSASDQESRCVGYALGYMCLDSKMNTFVRGKVQRAQGLDLEPIRVDLLAVVKPAGLLAQMEDDNGELLFRASAGDLLKAHSERKLVQQEFGVARHLQLKNTLEMPLHFKLTTRPPFVILKPQARARTCSSGNSQCGDGLSLVLQPQRSIQVKLGFHCSLSLLDQEDQVEEEVSDGVAVVHDSSGRSKLKFQQNLLIHFSNNSKQTVPLCGILDLPSLCLSTRQIDFGLCYVRQTHMRDIKLYNHGAHTYWNTVIESDEDDSCVFSVTPDFGLLRSRQLHVSNCIQCLQICFTPSEDREFRATVLIRSPLVKNPVMLQVQGSGSFDEVHRSI